MAKPIQKLNQNQDVLRLDAHIDNDKTSFDRIEIVSHASQSGNSKTTKNYDFYLANEKEQEEDIEQLIQRLASEDKTDYNILMSFLNEDKKENETRDKQTKDDHKDYSEEEEEDDDDDEESDEDDDDEEYTEELEKDIERSDFISGMDYMKALEIVLKR
ncbi:MAG: hypothetical protein EZS28_006236 [Streblomastix strix]|uniref:Uncharacterized protein n=1 Tax=Streblomastix strix TaxID=222440 RepID=A0A5J4WVK5_9EUKA|nr:MAG: hypothetical protein EZS28_006236 [Streblomastix strix]